MRAVIFLFASELSFPFFPPVSNGRNAKPFSVRRSTPSRLPARKSHRKQPGERTGPGGDQRTPAFSFCRSFFSFSLVSFFSFQRGPKSMCREAPKEPVPFAFAYAPRNVRINVPTHSYPSFLPSCTHSLSLSRSHPSRYRAAPSSALPPCGAPMSWRAA